jgi:hypothetical protein
MSHIAAPPRSRPSGRLPGLAGLVAVGLIVGLPFIGAWLGGHVPADLFQFPPRLEIGSRPAGFSWAAVVAVFAVLAGTLLPWARRRPRQAAAAARRERLAERAWWLPWWGTAALLWTLAWWTLAWTRWTWFAAWQRYTFFPLWLGFVLVVNALTQARTGSCLMQRAPRRWLALFAASAACWWVFEWLNRFVRNWHYLHVEDFGALAYALHATICFSTVLPATAAVAEWLDSHPWWRHRTAAGPRWWWFARPRAALWLAGGGSLALVGAGAFPDWFYPALWVGPLALLLALPDGARLRREVAGGDWRRAATWMIAALICGFFWELWNWHSLAQWVCTVPGVDRWHLFEMPALGYAGYLPFGLECLLVADWIIGGAWQARAASAAD